MKQMKKVLCENPKQKPFLVYSSETKQTKNTESSDIHDAKIKIVICKHFHGLSNVLILNIYRG